MPVLFIAIHLESVAYATGTIVDCGTNDAPGSPVAFNSADCDGGLGTDVCYDTGTGFFCDLERLSACATDGNLATAVQGYGISSNDFSAWGTCGTTNWCCALDDTDSDVVEFVLAGTAYDEVNMGFSYSADNMQPHRGGFTFYGRMYGREGDDNLNGSNSTNSSYWDKLFGNQGSDIVLGADGDDYIHGGLGAWDSLQGGPGDDRIVGGDGYDYMEGDVGSDTLCGQAKTGSSCDADYLAGMGGVDFLWVPYDVSCSYYASDKPTFDPGGNGAAQECGYFTWTTAGVAGCNVPINAEPPTCAEP